MMASTESYPSLQVLKQTAKILSRSSWREKRSKIVACCHTHTHMQISLYNCGGFSELTQQPKMIQCSHWNTSPLTSVLTEPFSGSINLKKTKPRHHNIKLLSNPQRWQHLGNTQTTLKTMPRHHDITLFSNPQQQRQHLGNTPTVFGTWNNCRLSLQVSKDGGGYEAW